MSDVLRDKRTATRFRILAEIAERQPAVSQGEIAAELGVTSQAVSEYIRDLVEEDLVRKDGRSRYRVTKEGVDWLFQEARELRRYADHVTEDVLDGVREDAAVATAAIEAGQTVTLSVREGLLYADPGEEGPATGIATTDAESGAEVSVTGFEGVIDIDPGTVTVVQVPPAREGGSGDVDEATLEAAVEDADLVVAAGVEAVVALRRIDREPAVTAGAGEVAGEAAVRGQRATVVASADSVGRVTDALRDAGVSYDVVGT